MRTVYGDAFERFHSGLCQHDSGVQTNAVRSCRSASTKHHADMPRVVIRLKTDPTGDYWRNAKSKPVIVPTVQDL
jgi:hypothetical protein